MAALLTLNFRGPISLESRYDVIRIEGGFATLFVVRRDMLLHLVEDLLRHDDASSCLFHGRQKGGPEEISGATA
ncbi:hypothetical protein H261_20607 [Paramagnetospirillum caucaseum]|uniref:Uncharacterized protein n=1 Tax=Paramagnetospirillum caucaseum TaxID=1244869 RepID=M2Z172_9PROT|nr:hypothetical protein [Paramagnetospirillum caucaseum]EME68020.1 hypothetical protein H261_20607 [Paramagnetospirillum caucaseum]